jgi:low affinity Fe/Cu permease
MVVMAFFLEIVSSASVPTHQMTQPLFKSALALVTLLLLMAIQNRKVQDTQAILLKIKSLLCVLKMSRQTRKKVGDQRELKLKAKARHNRGEQGAGL